VQRRVFITGASRGIGKEISDAFAALGFEVLAPGRQDLDLSQPEQVQAYLARVNPEADILVNNAGQNIIQPFAEIDLTTWQQTLDVNLTSAFLLLQHFSQGMRARKWGRIVNVSSIYGIVSRAGRASYAASKEGVHGLTKTAAIELAPFNVLVNAVAPGFIATDLTYQNNSPAQIEVLKQAVPMGRLGEPAEVAKLVVFLCSEDNSFMTGQTIALDGGFTIT